ncbi:Aldolase [Glarea lozoyensis ATCC 20868]|uniref:Isopropyl malate synthase gloH n=1 Tax=Glarea lozoyensis (strain ATCC 20868 / MF5171) TaxID=1116229 RepID=GLOH_GLAL2|nr:Aldolase [Glarea lozoyensis ATCC 20868]S3D9F8.1 RecName: Full=Isopropyl malate synthase gloH; AltName: Full=L-homotyrosine biosynthesis sub-cluster protein gloH; AltName: Full=Pneumocandin biosynthesis cluster protein H [Glarea lozoyensis ATCC 20868]EPE34345.1 Aldolase [Glarea lozoyensis ATCC 20868]
MKNTDERYSMATCCAGGQSLRSKYGERAPNIQLSDRQWPSKKLTKSPIWLSTDLRDGNQALPNPMTLQQKWRMFQLLVSIGFTQIEVSFPCASQTEFDFTRQLIETPGATPDDVTLEVLSPCREDAIATSVRSLKGAKQAILFLYLATSDNYRETVLQLSEAEWLDQAKRCVEYARSITKDDPENCRTKWSFGFGFEDFANARPEAALRLGETIKTAWGPSKDNPVILGLATSVEATTPNVFADQVEYFSRNITEREKVCISIHTHNDRGGAVASAELACLAGGDRVEGCLFGNGERAGNLDLITCSMNMFTQGIETGLDFSDLLEIRRVYEEVTNLPVHPRQPYSGDFYFRAFAGAHQDAIRKGLAKRGRLAAMPSGLTQMSKGMIINGTSNEKIPSSTWRVPYLPLDPADLGFSFDSVIGVNSQSGKGGIAWLIQQGLGFNIPNELAAHYSQIIKKRSVSLERGLAAEEICDFFLEIYDLKSSYNTQLLKRLHSGFSQTIDMQQELEDATAPANNAAMDISKTMGIDVHCTMASSHVISSHDGEQLSNVAFVQCEIEQTTPCVWGVGVALSREEAVNRSLLLAARRKPGTETPDTKTSVNAIIQPLEVYSFSQKA